MSTRNHCWIILTTILFIVLFIFNQFHQAHCLRSHFVGNRNRSWCHGSRKLEHLRGRCMFHYECVKLGGISIGHCFQNFLVGSCCMDRRSMLQMMMMTMLEPPSSSRHPQPQRQQQQHSQAIIDDDDGQNQNNFQEIQSKHLHRQHHRPTTVVSEELEILASGHPPIVKMDDFDAPTNPPPSSSSSSSSTSSPSTNNMTTTIDVDQNPIMAGMDNIDNCDDDGGGGPNVTDSIRIDRSSSSTEWPARLDESIRNSTTNTTSTIIGCDTKKSSSRPVMVNQNEFYEIVKDGNKSWTTPTITSTPPTSSILSSLPPSNNSASIDDDDDQKDSATAGTLNYNNNNFLVPNFIHLPPPIPLPLSTQVPVMMTTVGRSSKMCGVRPLRPTGRVVGGRNAQFGEWPWQVLIKEKSFLGFFTKSKCGGVLIDYKWVLTAAHCQPGKMGSLIVMAGQYELNQQHHQGSSAASGSSSSSGLSSRNGGGKFRPVVRTVKRMIVHRDFDPDTFDNDIALLELDEPFEMQPHIVPICLPNQEEDYVGQFAYVTGWGKLSYGGIVPTVLQTVRLPIIDNHICQKMFADAGHYKYIRNSFLCAGYPQGGRDTCEGDSGGPLMMKQNDVWTLVGTVSHGIKCAEPNLPGVYTKTWAFLPWIRGIIDRRSYSRRLTL